MHLQSLKQMLSKIQNSLFSFTIWISWEGPKDAELPYRTYMNWKHVFKVFVCSKRMSVPNIQFSKTDLSSLFSRISDHFPIICYLPENKPKNEIFWDKGLLYY